MSVSELSEISKHRVSEILKGLEGDKKTGQYVVWLRFVSGFRRKDVTKENVMEFLRGEFFHCYAVFGLCQQLFL